MLVMSLEDYDEVTGKATKAAIMVKDVVGKTPPVTQVRSAEEGLLVSLNQRGTVDLPYIATLYGKPEPQIIAELGDLIFHDPESKSWQTADAYLSGNVRSKLATAERAGPPICPQCQRPASRAARGRAARRHRRQSRCTVDTGERHPGIRGRLVPCRSVFGPRRPPEKRCRLEPGGRLRRQSIRGRHVRIRHRTCQRHLAAGTRPQHEDRRPSTTPSTTATARSAWSTRKRRWPPAKSKSSSRNSSAPGYSPIPTAPSDWCGSTTTPTTICVPACSTARTWIFRA